MANVVPIDDNIVIRGDDRYLPISSDPSGTGGHTIINGSGTEMTQRTGLKFEGATVTDDSSNDLTKVSINAYSPNDSADTTIANADYFPFYDTSATAKKKTLWSTIKQTLNSEYPVLNGGAVEINATSSSHADLNDYTTPGNYVCVYDANSPYVDNQPLTGDSRPGFNLFVMRSKNLSSYYRQILIYYNRDDCIFTRRTVDAGSNWNDWVSLVRDTTKVLKSGDTITGTLILSKNQDASGTADNMPALIVGGTDTQAHIEIDGNEIMAKANGTTVGTLNLNLDGGLIIVGGGGLRSKGEVTVNREDGTANAEGVSRLYLGNNIETGSPNNSAGVLTVFSRGSNFVNVRANTGSSDIAVYLPSDKSGATLFTNQGGTMTGNLVVPYLRAKRSDADLSMWANNENGTSNALGTSMISVGNGTGEGDAGNSRGIVTIYSRKTSYIQLLSQDVTSARSLYLPASGTAFATSYSSSARVKENIRDMTDEEALKILDVAVVKFDYKEEYEDGKTDQSGVIAEEVLDVIPEVVTMHPTYDETKAIDPASNPSPTVDYGKFAPYLIKMIQMQQQKIEELEQRLAALES